MLVKEEKYIDKNNRLVMTKLSTLEDSQDRSFDIEFWQRQDDTARLNAVWELVVLAHELKGRDVSELRLQRTIESIKRREG